MKLTAPVVFTSILTVIILSFFIVGLTYRNKAWIYPTVAAGPSLILVLFQLSKDLRGIKSEERVMDVAQDFKMPMDVVFKRAARFATWIGCLYIAIWIIGFKAGILLFLIFFLKLEGHLKGFRGWGKIVMMCAIMLFLLLVQYERVFGVRWPEGLIEFYFPLSRYITLPF
jgi:hypothetical protein